MNFEECFPILIALAFMILDVISGVAVGAKTKELSSTKMREGLFSKSGEVLILILAYMIELATKYVPDLNFNVPLLGPACALIILMECLSILENAGNLSNKLKDSKIMELFKRKDEK